LKNKKVLITGGARGIGKQIALEFARHGSDIIICDVDKSFFDKNEFENNVKDIKSLGVLCFGYYLDITKFDDIIEARKHILNEVGKIDILVNNAGIVCGGDFLKVPIEKHRLTYDVNTQGIINMVYVFLQDLIDRPISHIVNISSASGFTSLPGGATYASSKAAVTSFSESLLNELKKNGNTHVGMTITCTAYVKTGMFEGVKDPILIPMLTPEKLAKKIVRAVHLNKMFVLEPAFIKCIPIIKAIFPRFIYDYLGRMLGGYNSMDFWEGHSK
jgi:short-subunit dehydrogenase